MSGFTQMFSFGGDNDELDSPEEPKRPRWFGPPEDELGAALADVRRSGIAHPTLGHPTED